MTPLESYSLYRPVFSLHVSSISILWFSSLYFLAVSQKPHIILKLVGAGLHISFGVWLLCFLLHLRYLLITILRIKVYLYFHLKAPINHVNSHVTRKRNVQPEYLYLHFCYAYLKRGSDDHYKRVQTTLKRRVAKKKETKKSIQLS